MEKFIKIFDINFAITAFLLIAVLIAVAIDLYNGVQKAKKNGIARTSEGYRRTAQKLQTYYSLMFLSILVDCIISYVIMDFNTFIPILPYITIVISILFICTEIMSVREKADVKLQKHIKKSGTELLSILAAVKDNDLLNLLKDLQKKEEVTEN